jgi:Right handed beta helix region
MRLLVMTTVFLATALALAYPHAAPAATYNACGVGALSGGLPVSGCPSLPDAIASATANPGADTILLEGGSYCPIALTGANGEISFVGRGFAGMTVPIPGALTGPEAEASTITPHVSPCVDTGTLVLITNDPYTISFRNIAFEGETASGAGKAIEMHDTFSGPQVGSLVLRDVIVKDNTTGVWFSGFTPARFEMTGSTVTANSTGVFVTGVDSATITNSTIEGNTTRGLQAGNNYSVTLTNDTFTRNGYGIDGQGNGNFLGLANSIVAGNTFSDCLGYQIHSFGHNLSTGYCGPGPLDPTDQFAVSVSIGSLYLNGGPTWTILPPLEAVGHANNQTCPGTDQRGFLRADGACDIGAVETGAQPPPPPPPPVNTPPSASPQTLTFLNGAVSLTLNSVSTGGNTTATTSPTGPAIPAGFTLNGVYYEIATTAAFSTATLCITDPSVTASSRMLHYPGPTDVTRLPVVPTTICSTPLASFSPFAVVEPDTTPPTISVSHLVDGQNGWNLAPAPLSITAGDGGTGLAGAPTCTDAVNGSAATPLGVTGSSSPFATAPVSGDGTHVVTCTVYDGAGNHTAAIDTVKIDTQAPVVTYAGNAGTYTTAQVVSITCSIADPAPGSGVVSTTCPSSAAHYAVGTYTLTADTVDLAGNPGHGSTSFTVTAAPVTVTVGSLCLMTKQFIQTSARYRALNLWQRTLVDLLGNGLCQRLAAIGPSFTPQQKASFVRAYTTGVQALVAPGWLTQAQATTLIGLANQL